jgi:hypothetical protein
MNRNGCSHQSGAAETGNGRLDWLGFIGFSGRTRYGQTRIHHMGTGLIMNANLHIKG